MSRRTNLQDFTASRSLINADSAQKISRWSTSENFVELSSEISKMVYSIFSMFRWFLQLSTSILMSFWRNFANVNYFSENGTICHVDSQMTLTFHKSIQKIHTANRSSSSKLETSGSFKNNSMIRLNHSKHLLWFDAIVMRPPSNLLAPGMSMPPLRCSW